MSTPAKPPEARQRKARRATRLLGVDLEATPFVVLAAALALAVAVWLRPEWALLLGLIAVAMVVFAALDVREVFHQLVDAGRGQVKHGHDHDSGEQRQAVLVFVELGLDPNGP